MSGTLVLFVLTMGSAAAAAQTPPPARPPGMTHEQHMAQMKKDAELKQHGAMAMGFDQDKATHHFRLSDDGGAIEVTANDPADTVTAGQVRAHLETIAREFGEGVFEKPEMTHGETPPGIDAMQRLKGQIAYTYEPGPGGGRVRIVTADAEALAAVHAFLRYQIEEHRTGDPLTVRKPPADGRSS